MTLHYPQARSIKFFSTASLVVLVLLCWLVPMAYAQVSGQKKPILIRLKTDLTRAQLSAGHVPTLAGELNGWNPADSVLRFQPSDGYWWLRLGEDWNSKQYKLTLGSWDRVELNPMGSDVGNRGLFWNGNGDTVKVTVPRWKEKTETVKKRSTASKNVKKFYFGHYGELENGAPTFTPTDTAWVWLPKAYDSKSKKRWPVIYALDGANLFDDSTAFNGEWHLDEIMDAREKAGKPVAIVIGLIPEDRIKNYTMQEHPKYGGGGAQYYLARIVNTNWSVNHRKIPLNITSQAKHTYIIGSSLGGLFSSYVLEFDNIEQISRDYTGFFFGGGLIYSPAMWFEKEVEAYRIEKEEADRQAAEKARIAWEIRINEIKKWKHKADSIRKIAAEKYIKNRKIKLKIPLNNTSRDREFRMDYEYSTRSQYFEQASHTPHCPGGGDMGRRSINSRMFNPDKRRIVVLAGGQESTTMVSDAQALVDKLKLDPKAEVKFVIDPEGRHNERLWSKYLPEHLDYLLGVEQKSTRKIDRMKDDFITIKLETNLTKKLIDAGYVPHLSGPWNNWKPNDPNYKFVQKNGSWWLNIEKEMIPAEITFTLGSWSTVGLDTYKKNILRERLNPYDFDRKDTIHVTVPNWKNPEYHSRRSTASKRVRKLLYGVYVVNDVGSKVFSARDSVWVWLPKSYDPNSEKRWPVIFASDGMNLFDDQTSSNGEWHLDEIMDAREKKGKPVAIVIGQCSRTIHNLHWMNWSANHLNLKINISDSAQDRYLLAAEAGAFNAAHDWAAAGARSWPTAGARDFNGAILYDPTEEDWRLSDQHDLYSRVQSYHPSRRIVVLAGTASGQLSPTIQKLSDCLEKQSGAAYKLVQDPAPVRDERLWSKYLPEHLDYLLGSE